MSNILEAIEQAIAWYLSSDLPKDTMDCFGRIVTYCTEQLIPLMWEYIGTIWG